MTPTPHPDLLARLEALLPPEARARVERAAPQPVAFHLLTLRAAPRDTLAELAAAGVEPVPLPGRRLAFTAPHAQRDALTRAAPTLRGDLYILNPSSMLPPEALDPLPGEEVLDLAAAPGGKSIALADRMQNQGRLACVEPIRPRFFRLKANLERAGVTLASLYMADGTAVGRKVPARFDRVLLDAPCSSEARMRLDDPDSWAHWTPRKVAETSRKQRKLLLSALAAAKPGARVLYSTCALSPEENEAVIHHALHTLGPQVEVLPLHLPHAPLRPGLTTWRGDDYAPACALTARVVPDGVYDGFFLAALRRVS